MSAALLGVPPAKASRIAKRFTVPGALTSAVARYEYTNSLAKQQMMDVAKTAFERDYQNALENPYHVIGATDVYNVGGLGDLGDTGWGDIVKVFVGEIGKGLGGRISGQNPYIDKPPALPPPTPMWVKAAVIGGGALLGTFLLVNLVRR